MTLCAVDDEELKAVCCARFSVATLELLAKQTVSHMPLVCSAHVYNDAAAPAAGKHMIVGAKNVPS